MLARRGALLGWSSTDAVPADAPGTSLIATIDGQDDPAGGAGWNTHLAVADATDARVVAAGGTVVTTAADAGPGGRAAACADPAGTSFALWQARRRFGAQLVNAPGAWNSSDLLTADVEAALVFYAPLFGWHAEPQPEGRGATLRVPGAHGRPARPAGPS